MKILNTAAALTLLAAPAFADGHASGDAAAGQEQFERQCVSCHVVADADGNVLAGRAAKTGPSLYGLAGRLPGSVEGFRYGDALASLGEAMPDGWAEESFVAYVQDPTTYLRETLEDRRARSKMSYKVRDAAQATDIFAYLATFSD